MIDKKTLDREMLADAYNRGLDREHAGDFAAAAMAYREALGYDPTDPGGVAVRLAAIGRGEAPDKAPDAYVAALFGQYAEVFETILVDQLGYDVPAMIAARLHALGLGPFDRLLDLGCGTGLAGEALEDMATHLTGVDLAEAMVDAAGEKDLYDDLFIGEATRFLEEATESWDLIVAADVLPYVGDAAPLFQAAAARTTPGAVLAFSTETLSDDAMAGRNWMVGPHHRFAHRLDYIAQALKAAGFDMREMAEIVVRHEEGAPIQGHLVIAAR